MLAKRIIPCLDVKDNLVVKGVNFKNLSVEGTPKDLALYYEKAGADELCFLDISASHEQRKTAQNWVKQVARNIFIPFTVGGGIKSVADAQNIIRSGADKITVNTAAVRKPSLINELAQVFGSQAVVLAVDAKKEKDGDYGVYINGAREKTNLKLFNWLKEGSDRGAGEILLTSIDCDGVQTGYDLELLAQASKTVDIPLIASGGAGKLSHFYQAFSQGKADAVLAASVFHRQIFTITEVKKYLKDNKIPVRI